MNPRVAGNCRSVIKRKYWAGRYTNLKMIRKRIKFQALALMMQMENYRSMCNLLLLKNTSERLDKEEIRKVIQSKKKELALRRTLTPTLSICKK